MNATTWIMIIMIVMIGGKLITLVAEYTPHIMIVIAILLWRMFASDGLKCSGILIFLKVTLSLTLLFRSWLGLMSA